MLFGGSRAALALGLGLLAACAGQESGDPGDDESRNAPSSAAPSVTANASQAGTGSGVAGGSAGSPAPVANTTPSSGPTAGALPGTSAPSADGCAANSPFKKEGCPCRAGETAACWTGPAADRNVGKCHDGLQICTAKGEFASWGVCMGEELSCGVPDAGVPMTDAGTPPPPGECPCIPGAVIQCSEDCTTGIICSLTATKTCLPDRTWSVCREDLSVPVDLPGVQCRNMLHGCLSVLSDGTTQGQGEIYVGDCSSQFTCGHAPSPL